MTRPPAPPLTDPGDEGDRHPSPASGQNDRHPSPASGLAACRHGPRAGSLDESARRLTHQELAVARLFAGQGHRVESLADWPWLGPSPDLLVCGKGVEVKSFLAAGVHPAARAPSPVAVRNKLIDAGRQGDIAVIWARGSALSEEVVRMGVAMYAGRARHLELGEVRVIGDGFELAWSAAELARMRAVAAGLPWPPAPRGRQGHHGLGLGA